MLDDLRRVVQEVNTAENLDDALLIIVREVKSAMGVDVWVLRESSGRRESSASTSARSVRLRLSIGRRQYSMRARSAGAPHGSLRATSADRDA